ncbi:hypothetical protein N8482_01240 [Chitinophagales bacterium]|nr:hypothetical protein [Chitinophagales bacterium]
MGNKALNFLCISSYFKGEDFLRSLKEQGNNVYLVTAENLRDEAWPWESITDVFYVKAQPDESWIMDDLFAGLAHTFRSLSFDRIAALDDFDVEKAAALREHFRIPGMGQTTARYFRDKLAMRVRAQSAGIKVPAFTPLFNDEQINRFADTVPTPWMVKPRSAATASGITKIHSKDELWKLLDSLGADRHRYLLEKFAPGTVYHVDALNLDGKVIFDRASAYLSTPFEVAHGGGIFRSQTVKRNTKDDKALRVMNAQVMKAFGMNYSASHTEFIKGDDDGEFYFLETASRVGGANLAEMVEMASGINLWKEWAVIEDCVARGKKYKLPKQLKLQAGIIVSLSRHLNPDHSPFNAEEIVWRLKKDWHVGMILTSKDADRVRALLDEYAEIIGRDYHASLPAEKTPIN